MVGDDALGLRKLCTCRFVQQNTECATSFRARHLAESTFVTSQCPQSSNDFPSSLAPAPTLVDPSLR